MAFIGDLSVVYRNNGRQAGTYTRLSEEITTWTLTGGGNPGGNQTPVPSDYIIGNLNQTARSVTAVTITANSGKSPGTVSNIRYNNSTTIPQTAGTYAVTFDVAAAAGWSAAIGLSAGNLVVNATNQTPVAGDYTFGNMTQTAGSVTAVTITAKSGKSPGAISNIRYAGNTAIPQAHGSYAVTFDVAAASNWSAASRLAAGNLNINSNLTPDGFTITQAGDTITITKYTGTNKDVTIPAEINGKPVTAIGDRAFSENFNLTSVNIPVGVTSIGLEAFVYCTNLTSITIPASVTYIGHYAFNYCRSLTSFTIPASVTSIGMHVFYGCTNLTSITVNTNNPNYTSDENGILYNKAKTTLIQAPGAIIGAIIIPTSVTSISWRAFAYCTLNSVTIPANVKSIGDQAFNICTNLISITVDTNNTNYASEGGILYNKAKTTLIQAPGAIIGTVSIPSSVTTIGSTAFSSCTGITSVIIPASVSTISGWAFSGCKNIASITIPASVTAIGSGAFASWTANQTIYIEGYASRAAADAAWNKETNPWWLQCNAVRKYWNGNAWVD